MTVETVDRDLATARLSRRGARPLAAIAGIVGLVTVATVVPLVVAHHYGALHLPRSDDWSYLRVLFERERSGRWEFNDWVAMTLVGQVLITEPVVAIFGTSITAVRVFTATLGVAGLAGILWLGRALPVPRVAAYVAAFAIAAGPVWGPLAATYMTDVPGFAFQTLALAAGAHAVRRIPLSVPWLAVALLLGVVGFSIRQYGVIPVIAICIVALVVARREEHRQVLAVVAVSAVAFLAMALLYYWWATLPEKLLEPSAPTMATARLAFATGAGFVRLFGFVLIPVVLLAGPVGILKRAFRATPDATVLVGVATATFLAVGYVLESDRPFVGNYLDRRGTLSDDIIVGPRPEVMPTALFELLVVAGSAAAVVAAIALVPLVRSVVGPGFRGILQRVDPVVALLALAALGYVASFELAVLLGFPMFDRYALPAFAPVALLVLAAARPGTIPAGPDKGGRASSSPPAARAAGLALAGFLALGVVYSAESASFDAKRWALAEAVHRQGFPQRAIYAGYEWPGFLFGRAPSWLDDPDETRAAVRRAYYEGVCVEIVAGDDRRPPRAIAESRYFGLLRGPAHLYALRKDRPCAEAAEPDFVP